ncbi:AAA family ATPase [Nostocoides sp. F2B08]|uniref:ATP-dependent helicase n=1 Tax=Nostocoides sp. F2B08 TaxID=2653936 RepID=UPI001262EE8C|nr:ATP-dependent DNA helicase [Tetrasphaera sp. F2B08]KAB7746216.1 AAA family ATPase [Tetrasphaera sp. F2B08]
MSFPVPTDEQRAAIDHRGGVLRVLGSARTGKTETATAIVLDRIRTGEVGTDQVLVLASTRQAAAGLRRRIMAELGGTATAPIARTAASLAFGVLRAGAALVGDPPPRLLNGPEQDVVIRDLLAGHAAGDVTGPDWPESVLGALPTRAFRAELRDLLMRAVENSLGAADLVELADRHGVAEWRAAAVLLEEYDRVTALASPGAYDPAWIVAAAAEALRTDAALAGQVRAGLRLIVVDDAQELTPGAARLLATIVGLASPQPLDIVLLGDPDSGVQSFRGADPAILAGGAAAPLDWTTLSRTGAATTIRLRTAYRPDALLAASRRVASAVGSVGEVAHREVVPADPRAKGTVETHLLRTPSAEAAYVAARIREAVLLDGRRWGDIAVVVRGGRRSDSIRRALARADVPVAADVAEVPVRDEPAVRPVLQLLRAVLGAADGDDQGDLTPAVVVELLGSRVGGTDAVQLRRLRRGLRRIELAGGGGRPSDDLLVEAIRHPIVLQEVGIEATGARRVAAAYRAGLDVVAALDEEGRPVARRDVLVEDVLWSIWSALGLADRWRATALAGGAHGARADRDLDAVLALFAAAARFTDRLPHADPMAFLEHVEEQELPGDTLAVRTPEGDSVAVLTPAGAAGRSWPLVIISGVQDGVWPDTRLRGQLLRSTELVDRLRGRDWSWRSAAAAVRHDETRLFHVAVTRATEHLIATAVRDETEQPSPYLDLLEPGGVQDREPTEVSRPTTSRELVAWLRQNLMAAPTGDPDPAVAAGLARLAEAGVAGADPEQWWALRDTTSARVLLPRDVAVDVSPSRIQTFEDCPLRWLLTTRGGDGPPVGSSALGTLVHDIARDLGDAPTERMAAEVNARWGLLGLTPGWVSDRTRALAHDMVERLGAYVEQARSQGWRAVGAEVSMRVALDRAVLRGQVDRIEADEQGRVRIIDYKTGSTATRKADLPRHAQLGAYQVALGAGAFDKHLTEVGLDVGERGPESAGAALLQLGKAAGRRGAGFEEQRRLDDDPDPRWAHALIEATAEGMSSGTFEARPEEQRCQRCPVRRTCPAQPEGASLA